MTRDEEGKQTRVTQRFNVELCQLWHPTSASTFSSPSRNTCPPHESISEKHSDSLHAFLCQSHNQIPFRESTAEPQPVLMSCATGRSTHRAERVVGVEPARVADLKRVARDCGAVGVSCQVLDNQLRARGRRAVEACQAHLVGGAVVGG